MKEIRQYYVYFFESSFLKDNNYEIQLKFNDAKKLGFLTQTFESQVIRSINDIRKKNISDEKFFKLKDLKKKIKRRKKSKENYKELIEVQKKIDKAMFISDYIVIEMNHNSHYDYLFANGLKLNGKTYKRFSCSASQARVSNVMFVNSAILKELNKRIDNGRNKKKELVPSKFNAYKGLSSSATRKVSEPRFCVVKDLEVDKKLKCWYVTETEDNKNDILEKREIDVKSNLFDGQGLITPEFAKVWAKDLEVDYIPAQFCIRQSFIKGMVCTFDILKFCEKINNNNFLIKDIYGNMVDLREIDIVLTESQFKLWDSYPDLKTYIENCHKNKQYWGVSLFTPKQDKDVLNMNYQFLQTLNLNDEDIKELCSQFLEWIKNITIENVDYTFLYLLGRSSSDERNLKFIFKNGDDYLVKSFAVNQELINDRYLRERVFETLKVKINEACLGRIIVDGNFQVMVSDPYALAEHICGLEVKGLLKEKEYYSNYWNKRNVKRISASRSPLNYKSEHLVYDLVKNEFTEDWYKYCYTGIILNIHGNEPVHHGGSDFDYDIIATSSNKTIIKGIDMSELPIYYEPPKSTKMKITDEDLFLADIFSFGSAIGSITNKGSSAYALMGNFEKDSEEYKELLTRVRMCTKLQSAEIDKAKIGRNVKSIPKFWIRELGYKSFESYKEDYVLAIEKNNELLLDKHPYFFIYLYEDTKRNYSKFLHQKNLKSNILFGMDAEDVLKLDKPTDEQRKFINFFKKESPVIISNSVMNKICNYIEEETKNIRAKFKDSDTEIWKRLYLNNEYEFENSIWNNVKRAIDKFLTNDSIEYEADINLNYNRYLKFGKSKVKRKRIKERINKINEMYVIRLELRKELFLNTLLRIVSDKRELTNYVVKYFYEYKTDISKRDLWNVFGDCIFENILKNTPDKKTTVFVEDEKGNIEYLGKRYRKEIKEYEF